MFLWVLVKMKLLNILNNSVLEDKCVLSMYFNPNKTPVEGAFGGTCFRDIYFGDNGK